MLLKALPDREKGQDWVRHKMLRFVVEIKCELKFEFFESRTFTVFVATCTRVATVTSSYGRGHDDASRRDGVNSYETVT